MTDTIEQKALVLLNEPHSPYQYVAGDHPVGILARAIEQHEALEAENERLRGLVQGWHYLAVGPDEMGDYYTHKQLIKASEPYAHPALRALRGAEG